MPENLRKAKKALALARRPRWRAALKSGVAATIEHMDVPFPFDYRTVIDVGGHHGQFTLFALERFPRADVITFEPQADGAALIRRLTADEQRVTVHNCALGAHPGSAELNISKRSDSSSLLPIGRGQTSAFPGTETAATTTVEVETLDALLPTAPQGPTLLKIDVQGFELDVLRGARRVLSEIETVYVECSFVELYSDQPLIGEVIQHLRECGFRLDGVHGVTYDADGRCLQADCLFGRV